MSQPKPRPGAASAEFAKLLGARAFLRDLTTLSVTKIAIFIEKTDGHLE
jgi:hypothetical protein